MTKPDIEREDIKEDIKKEEAEAAGEKEKEEEKKDCEEEKVSEESQKAESHEKEETPSESRESESRESEEDADARYLRLMADFQNYKKRTEKEKADIYSYANEKIITEMLEVLDNFERALGQEESGDSFKEGMEMIFKQLGNVLEKAGLAEIAALGEDFDPNFHNAVMTEETEEYESGKVSGVMQKGYTLNGKLIRPSMVKVAG